MDIIEKIIIDDFPELRTRVLWVKVSTKCLTEWIKNKQISKPSHNVVNSEQ